MNKFTVILSMTITVGIVFIVLLATVGISKPIEDANTPDDIDGDGIPNDIDDDGTNEAEPILVAELRIDALFNIYQHFGDVDLYGYLNDPIFNVYPYTSFEEGQLFEVWKLELLPATVLTYQFEVWTTARVYNDGLNYDIPWESKHVNMSLDVDTDDTSYAYDDGTNYIFKTRFFFWFQGYYNLEIHVFGKLNGGETMEIGAPYMEYELVGL